MLFSGKLVSMSLFSDSDISREYVGWLNDAAVVKYSNQRFLKHTHDSCRIYMQSFFQTSNYFLKISELESHKMIGTMTIYISKFHGTADVGLLIGSKYWGSGYGKDAFAAAVAYLFQNELIRKVTAGTLESNLGMIRVLEHAGMTLEATRVDQEIVDGHAVNMLYYAKFNKF
jgi:ribosomal-protein-alanine N-acetyltransferase